MRLKIRRYARAATLAAGLALIAGCNSYTYTPPDAVARTADPASPHHADYVLYRAGGLSEAQLIDRLPHVALIGDSLSRDFYISSVPSMIWRSKLDHGHDWFLDDDPATGGIDSVAERIGHTMPVVAIEYASPGGTVDSEPRQSRFLEFLWPQNFSEQVDRLLADDRFPDLLMIWMGHNNINWARGLSANERADPESFLKRDAVKFRQNYARELARVIEQAKRQSHRTAIVVFGVVNFKSFFEARAKAEALKSRKPDLYPYLENAYDRFESMRPEYRGNMIRLALMMNDQLLAMVAEFNRELGNYPQVSLRYSNALAMVDISAVDLISQVDAWHPSAKGHDVLAGAAYNGLKPSLEFLGIAPR